MSGEIFVDTNVFLYALDQSELRKQAAARRWREELWRSRRGRISFQVLEEFYAQVMRKWPKTREAARAEIRDLLAWRPLEIGSEVLERAWLLQDRYQLAFWDALIVACAQITGCSYLLTEDLQHGQRFEGVQVLSPFACTPESVLP
ncbi:MAG: PIN domain-containing protein [Acidobacteria bacterium]|nr:PIN domain-containing protein [Acidobacteriota bacterium]MBV9146645.1 PIN domain-containing protein [Acidobacteriota bacterium]MBV9435618.1 PIN domain-containing protein [Acidobacteriota bacterium]